MDIYNSNSKFEDIKIEIKENMLIIKTIKNL